MVVFLLYLIGDSLSTFIVLDHFLEFKFFNLYYITFGGGWGGTRGCAGTPEHRKYLNYNTEDFMRWAESVGEKTAKVVSHFLTAGKEPEQGFKACASLTKLGEKYGVKKLESACDGVFSYTQTPSIRLISTILKSGTGASKQSGSGQSGSKQSGKGQFDKAHDGTQTHDINNSNAYGITRGAAYYSNLRKDGESK